MVISKAQAEFGSDSARRGLVRGRCGTCARIGRATHITAEPSHADRRLIWVNPHRNWPETLSVSHMSAAWYPVRPSRVGHRTIGDNEDQQAAAQIAFQKPS